MIHANVSLSSQYGGSEYQIDRNKGDYYISLRLYEHPSLGRLPLFDASSHPLGDQLVLDQVVTVK